MVTRRKSRESVLTQETKEETEHPKKRHQAYYYNNDDDNNDIDYYNIVASHVRCIERIMPAKPILASLVQKGADALTQAQQRTATIAQRPHER